MTITAFYSLLPVAGSCCDCIHECFSNGCYYLVSCRVKFLDFFCLSHSHHITPCKSTHFALTMTLSGSWTFDCSFGMMMPYVRC